ncbi:MAG: hypothetical protein MZV64_13270 [Ignavibacteriales bacterium]|nr:hypothetical protein [Ignavibacteriales bacterium]
MLDGLEIVNLSASASDGRRHGPLRDQAHRCRSKSRPISTKENTMSQRAKSAEFSRAMREVRRRLLAPCWSWTGFRGPRRPRTCIGAGTEAARLEGAVLLRAFPRRIASSRCELFKATRENDVELKKAVHERWEMKKKFWGRLRPRQDLLLRLQAGRQAPEGRHGRVPRPDLSGRQRSRVVRPVPRSGSCDKSFWKEWPNAFESGQEAAERDMRDSPARLSRATREK